LKNIMKKKKLKSEMTKIYLPAQFDKVNQMLKYRFSVKHINYVTDNGIIQNGWLISNKNDIDEAIKLLKIQPAPIYILGKHCSAIVGWDAMHSNIVGSLWQNQKSIDEIKTSDFEVIKKKLIEWFDKSKGD